ncbi:caspase domain-containing protein [Streptomyces sp. NPDC053427]|uniref:caspase domain-containing protein n=1 Tax=Streptomyces sp. NPDC053427 TaxID=3365701 RepID=UPI0037CE0141
MTERTDRRRIAHGPSSRAVLIGTGRFSNAGLPDIPSVAANLRALHATLTDPAHGLLAPEHCRVVSDPADQATVGAALSWAVREATDLLLVYYAGHGVLDGDGLLHLGLRHTDIGQVGFSAVPIELIKRNVGDARAASRVLIVDCCFSGRAVSAMAEPTNLAVGQLDLTGTYTLTSTTKTAPAHAPFGATYTAFTGALLDGLAQPSPLSLDELHGHVDRELHGLGLPRPQRRSAGATGALMLVRGPVRPREGRRTVPPRPSAMPPPPPPPAPAVFPHIPPRPAPLRNRRRPLVIAAVLGGTLAALLAVPLVKGMAGGGEGTGGNGGSGKPSTASSPPTASHGGEPTPMASRSATPVSPRPTPSGTRVVYRDKQLTWTAVACIDGSQVLDLDAPSFDPGDTYGNPGAEFLYRGCTGTLAGGAIETNTLGSRVKVGRGDAGIGTAAACRAAARERQLPRSTAVQEITGGTVWCVITTEGRVAKMRFTKVGPPFAEGFAGSAARNPTLELSVTLWRDS